MIDAKDLTRTFGNVTAVDRVTFHVEAGEVFGFLGPNGAGKTTTVRMLCCLISKTSGEARIADFILGLKKQKRTIFLNTHNLDEAQRICDKIGILNTKLMAIGTPEELERAVSGRKTVVQLERATDSVLSALKELPLGNIAVAGNRLTIEVTNPEKENAAIVDAIVQAGGHIQSVVVEGSTLEDAYVKLVRASK